MGLCWSQGLPALQAQFLHFAVSAAASTNSVPEATQSTVAAAGQGSRLLQHLRPRSLDSPAAKDSVGWHCLVEPPYCCLEAPRRDSMGLLNRDVDSELEVAAIWNGCSDSASLGCLLARKRSRCRSTPASLDRSGIWPEAVVLQCFVETISSCWLLGKSGRPTTRWWFVACCPSFGTRYSIALGSKVCYWYWYRYGAPRGTSHLVVPMTLHLASACSVTEIAFACIG